MNEKWPEKLACCPKRIYLNACAAHDSFPLKLSRLEALLPFDSRYELSSVQDNIHSYVADLIKDQLTRRQLVDNTTRNLLRLMSSACGLSEIRSLSSQRLEVWLQNPKVCCGKLGTNNENGDDVKQAALRLFSSDAFFLRTFTYVCSIRVNERVYVF